MLHPQKQKTPLFTLVSFIYFIRSTKNKLDFGTVSQVEIISLILYHNSTFIITNLSKPDKISFVVGECHLNSEASLPPPHHYHSNKEFPCIVVAI
jgi:hypothetical protein